MESLRNVHNPVIRRTLSLSHPCGSIKAGGHGGPRGVSPIKHHPAMRDNHVGAHVRSNDTIAAQFLVIRCPHGCHLFASLEWPRHTVCSLEALDMTAY